MAVAINDVTERRRAEDEIRAARDRSEEILEAISDGFYAMDAEWRFVIFNRARPYSPRIPRPTSPPASC